MRERVVRRALVLTVVLSVAAATVASADTLHTGDSLAGPTAMDLGAFAPGETRVVDVPFVLVCAGSNHLNPGQQAFLTPSILMAVPPGGAASAANVTIGPPPAGWPVDGAGCTGVEPFVSVVPGAVTITAPLADGQDLPYQVAWTRTYSAGDVSGISGSEFTFASFTLDVVSNTPPTLILPSGVTQEGDTTGGAIAAYSFGATDAEDDPDPVASCTPAPGAFVPLGTTQVSCSVTDAGGLTTSGGFELTVVDTSAPILAGVPAGLELSTVDSAGASLVYDLPTASDVVDPNPTVACVPLPGATAPVGDSEVVCTATDASGNATAVRFPVHVSIVTATWESPVGGNPPWLVGNHGRTVPVKVALFVEGTALTTGAVDLVVGPCGSGAALLSAPMTWMSDAPRWFAHLDTALLPGPGCYTVTASVDGVGGPAFTLDLRGAVQASAAGRARRP